MSNILRIFVLACFVAAGPAGLTSAMARSHAAHPRAITDDEVSGLSDQGGYIWSPDLAPQGPVAIVISLPEQRAYVYRDGVLIGASATSTGTEGRETPTGVFPILEKEVVHHSSKYNDAPMPFMQRLTWYGVALHGGPLPGYAATHGCIRLPIAFARKLFGVTSVGTKVVVTDGPPDAALASADSVEPSASSDEAPAPDEASPDAAPPPEIPDAP